MSNRARSDIRMFASYLSDHFRIVYVKAYCSIYVKIVLIMKDDSFADENVGWTCLPSTPEQSERFKFDVHISSIISSYMSRIMTKLSSGLPTRFEPTGLYTVHCIAVIRKVNGLKLKGLHYLCCKTNVLTSYAETT